MGSGLGTLTVLLTTTGRHSGKARTIAIWAYPDDDALILIGSSGGRSRTPAWVYNLRAQPEATVQVHREVHAVWARDTTGEEYERLWRMVVAAYPGFETYRQWAHRAVPLFVLERVESRDRSDAATA